MTTNELANKTVSVSSWRGKPLTECALSDLRDVARFALEPGNKLYGADGKALAAEERQQFANETLREVIDELARRSEASERLRHDALREAVTYCRSQVDLCSKPDPKGGLVCGMFECLAAAVTSDMERHFGLMRNLGCEVRRLKP